MMKLGQIESVLHDELLIILEWQMLIKKEHLKHKSTIRHDDVKTFQLYSRSLDWTCIDFKITDKENDENDQKCYSTNFKLRVMKKLF